MVYYSVNGEIRKGFDVKDKIRPAVKVSAWVSNRFINANPNVAIKRMKITKKALLPGRNLCSSGSHPWGIYAGNRPTRPVQGFLPCNKPMKKLGSEFTIKFKYIPRQITRGDKNLFRFTSTKKKCCGLNDQAPALYIKNNSFNFKFVIGTVKRSTNY